MSHRPADVVGRHIGPIPSDRAALPVAPVAVLAAGSVARRPTSCFPVPRTGSGGLVAHECTLDSRGVTRTTGVTVPPVAAFAH